MPTSNYWPSAPTAVVAQLTEFSNLLSHSSPSCARGGTLVLLLARQRRSWAGGESTEQAEGRRGHRRMHQWGSRYTPGGLGRSGKVGRGARLLGSQHQSAPACDLPQAQLFRLWRVASTEWPRPRGQEAVLLALPPARSGASAGCKEAAGSGAAALVTGSRRWPEHGPRLPAAFPVVNLPIYFSSGDDRRMQRARATTARVVRIDERLRLSGDCCYQSHPPV